MYYGSSWRPVGRTNHGDLIDPPRPLPALALPRVEGSSSVATRHSRGSSAFLGKWSLVYVGPGDCDADCRNTLYFMRQTHLGLGNLMPRVQRVFLVSHDCCDRDYRRTITRVSSCWMRRVARAGPLLAQFPASALDLDLHRRSARQPDDALRRQRRPEGPARRPQEAARPVAHRLTDDDACQPRPCSRPLRLLAVPGRGGARRLRAPEQRGPRLPRLAGLLWPSHAAGAAADRIPRAHRRGRPLEIWERPGARWCIAMPPAPWRA